MKHSVTIMAMTLASTMAFAQANKPNTQDYQVNQSGAQKITNGPVIEYTSDHSAMIAWSTKYPGGTYLAYGTDRNNLSQRTEKAWGGTNHRLEIKNLQPSTTYYFQVRSENAHGANAMGADVQGNVESFQTVAKGAAADKANRNVGVNGADTMQTAGTNGSPSTSASGQFQPLYSMLGGNKHFYTTNPSEHASAAANYKDEGIVGYLATSQVPGTQPFYRLSNAGSGAHAYTANSSERQSDISGGFRDEGAVGYIATSQLPNTVPLYRLSNQNGDNVYTTNASERQSVLQQGGWSDQGIAGYIWSQPQ